jgi:small subunit ribosomal protein S13
MARVVGVDLPRDKRVEAGLLAIFGVGPSRAHEICEKSGVNPDTRVRELTDAEVSKLTATVQEYAVEGDLRREGHQLLPRAAPQA